MAFVRKIPLSALLILPAGLLALSPGTGCSSPDGDSAGRGDAVVEPDGAFIEPTPDVPSIIPDDGPTAAPINDFSGGGPSGPVPENIGSEELCDGIDENNNGIIDDVDVGNDGLCDCLNIAFLGELASNAGDATGAFEDWLEARSDIPVTHIGARDELAPETFSSLQVVIVGNMTERVGNPYSSAELASLESFVTERGGGVMSLAGYTANETAMEPTVELMGFTGMGYAYQGTGPGILGQGAPPVRITGISAPDHPTVDGVDAVGVYFGYPVTGDGEVIFEQEDYVLAMAKQVGNGRAFAFADEWITQDRLWLPQMQTQTALTQCQQRCMQVEEECGRCETQCAECETQPCQGGGDLDPATCPRGCDSGCESCSAQCEMGQMECTTCMAAESAEPELDMARFWLNVISWLTPDNECKVRIPIDVAAR